jgi:hypothetical protein
MSKSQSDNDALKAIRDLASEEIMSLSDSKIRARAKEEFVDIEKNASTIRDSLRTHFTMNCHSEAVGRGICFFLDLTADSSVRSE